MTVPNIPPELLAKTLPELLNLIVAGKLTGDLIVWANQRIKELFERKEYGFTPEPEFASGLQQVSKSDAYNRMKECIGNHTFLSLVKLALRIEELNDEGRTKIVERTKNEVYKKHGVQGVRVLNMGSTGVIIPIIQYMSDIKLKHDHSQTYMIDIFEKVIDQWKKITIFHKSEIGQKGLEKKIVDYMSAHYELFFVFSIGEASEQAKKAIASLSNSNKIRKKGYMFGLYSRKEDVIGKEWYSWVFKNLYNFDSMTL